MKTVKFDGHNYDGVKHVYVCSDPGDQSGEYVRVEDVVVKLREEIEKVPGDKHGLIYSNPESYMDGFKDGFVNALNETLEFLEGV